MGRGWCGKGTDAGRELVWAGGWCGQLGAAKLSGQEPAPEVCATHSAASTEGRDRQELPGSTVRAAQDRERGEGKQAGAGQTQSLGPRCCLRCQALPVLLPVPWEMPLPAAACTMGQWVNAASCCLHRGAMGQWHFLLLPPPWSNGSVPVLLPAQCLHQQPCENNDCCFLLHTPACSLLPVPAPAAVSGPTGSASTMLPAPAGPWLTVTPAPPGPLPTHSHSCDGD